MRFLGVLPAIASVACFACVHHTSTEGVPGDAGAQDVTPPADTGPLSDTNPGPPAGGPWVPGSSKTTANLNGVWSDATAAHVFAVGDAGTILESTDLGATWQALPSGSTVALHGIWGSSALDLYAVGDRGTLLHSTDGGKTWPAAASGVSPTLALYSVWGSGPGNVFASGDGATIVRSNDGGKTWTSLPNPAVTGVVSLWGTSATDIYAAAEAAVLVSQDDGATWTSSGVISVTPQTAIWASSPSDIYCVNTGGAVDHFDGTGWTKYLLTPTRQWQAVWGSGPNDVYIAGDQGAIANATDGQSDFTFEVSGTAGFVRAVTGAAGRVFAVGDGGYVATRGP